MRDFEEEARIVQELTRKDNGTDPFSSAVRATRMPMIITDPRQPDNPIVFANGAFSRLTGFERHEIVGRNCRFLQGRKTNQVEMDRLRKAIAARTPVEVELLNDRKDGKRFWNRLLVSPVFADDGELTYYFASHELATDAAKYGARSCDGVSTLLAWKLVDGWRPCRLHFTWKETVGLAVTAPTPTGFGTKLIERVLAREIAGKAEIDFRSDRLVFSVIAPLPETMEEAVVEQ